MFKYTKIS